MRVPPGRDPLPLVALALLLVAFGAPPGSLSSPLVALDDESTRVSELREQGMELYRLERYGDAVTAFRGALQRASAQVARKELEEFLARSLSAHGVELFNAGENRQAERLFREALEQHDDFYAHFGLGFLHFTRLEDREAREHLRQAALLEPTYDKTYKLEALIEYRQGRVAAAVTLMEKVLGHNSDDQEAKETLSRWRTEATHSRHFRQEIRGKVVVRIDPAISRDDVRQALTMLENVLREQTEILAVKDHGPLLMVFFGEELFHRATGSYHWVGGFYDGQLKVPVAQRLASSAEVSDEFRSTLRHEVTHFLIQALAPGCPNWLNEGLAQYFEKRHQGEAVRKSLLKQAPKRTRLRDVPARLWEVDDPEFARLTYLEGLGFVQFLAREYRPFRLLLLLDAITEEGSVSRAFEVTYGRPLTELESLWWAWVSNEEATGKPEPGGAAARSRGAQD